MILEIARWLAAILYFLRGYNTTNLPTTSLSSGSSFIFADPCPRRIHRIGKICSRFFLPFFLLFQSFTISLPTLYSPLTEGVKDPSMPRINSFGCESNCPNIWPLSCGIRNIWDHVQSLTATARCCNRRDFGISRRWSGFSGQDPKYQLPEFKTSCCF